MPDTLYRELLWIARKAEISPGWAYHRYKALTHCEPKDSERGTPVMPPVSLLEEVRGHMNKYAFAKVVTVLSDKLLTADQKRIKSQAWKELDQKRPRLEDL